MNSFWSKPRGPLVLGVAACAACCAVPLTGVVIGAGAASTLAAIVEPLAGVMLAAAAMLAIAIVVLRRRATRAAASCATDGSCGCGPVDDEPIACTADLRDTKAIDFHMDEYRAAFNDLARAERTANGFRWVFRSMPGLEQRIRGLAAREHVCCQFFDFDVTATGNEIVWEVRGADAAKSVVDEFFRLPERLLESDDLSYVKAKAIASGLTFTADRAS